MFATFFGSDSDTKHSDKQFLEDNRAQRLLISILDGSFEKQVQTWSTSSKTGLVDSAKLLAATVVNSVGYANLRQTVDALRDVSASSIQLPINIIQVLGKHQGIIPKTHREAFDKTMTILTAILKIEQAGFAKVRGNTQEANNAYTDKFIEIIRVLINEKEMVPSAEDIAIMKELKGAFSEFIPQAKEIPNPPASTVLHENQSGDDELGKTVDQIIDMVKTLKIQKEIEPEEPEQIILPRNYFRLWDTIQKSLVNKDSNTLSLGLQNLTENYEFNVYAGALISIANDFNLSQSPSIKQKLLDLKIIIEEKLEHLQQAEDQSKPQNMKS
jgi:hypothetical protein